LSWRSGNGIVDRLAAALLVLAALAAVEERVIAIFSLTSLGRLNFDRANRLMPQRG
jgi:hypothetical protein